MRGVVQIVKGSRPMRQPLPDTRRQRLPPRARATTTPPALRLPERQCQLPQFSLLVSHSIEANIYHVRRSRQAEVTDPVVGEALQDSRSSRDVHMERVSLRFGQTLGAMLMIACGGTPPRNPPGWYSHGPPSDCSGTALGTSVGSVPDPANCSAAGQSGDLAICWDQVADVNPDQAGPWCNYVRLSSPSAPCVGGPHPGKVYQCLQN
jgi:hypothetical protein